MRPTDSSLGGAVRRRDRASAYFGEIDMGTLALHVPEQSRSGVPQRRPRHHIVNLAVLQQKLGRLKALGKILPDGLLDHPLAGKADNSPGLG
jgi:hypothetical protein